MVRWLKRIKQWLVFHREVFLDGRRFRAAIPSIRPGSPHRQFHLASDIVRRYHVLEKGLAMPEFRPGFGRPMVSDLVNDLVAWNSLGLPPDGQTSAAQAALRAYRDRHAELGFDLGDLLAGVDLGEPCELGSGGTRPVEQVSAELGAAFEAVARSRASVRTFEPDRIPDRGTILEAVAIAARAPSVCNRQTARVHAFTGSATQELLKFQNGNRGFGHRVPLLFVVTSDLRFFTGVSERNQGWIDGGLFAMLFLLGLHAKGLGAVALNWSVKNDLDSGFRKVAKLPSHERVIMLIGCGYPESDAVVPVSQRRPADQIVSFHHSP